MCARGWDCSRWCLSAVALWAAARDLLLPTRSPCILVYPRLIYAILKHVYARCVMCGNVCSGSWFSMYVPHSRMTAKLHSKDRTTMYVYLVLLFVGPKTLCRRSIRGVRCRCCCGTSALPRSSSSSSRSCRRQRRLAATARTAVGALGSFAKVRKRDTERETERG